MIIASSNDGGRSFPQKTVVYAGPAGYSDMGVLSDGDILLLFENGAVEYNKHLSIVKVRG
ncbi:hypothetical protein ACFLZW_01485 [Chloroflexota bacterium]